MDEFPYFLREWNSGSSCRFLFLPANMAEEEVAAFVVYMAVACISPGLLVQLHLALCSQRLPP